LIFDVGSLIDDVRTQENRPAGLLNNRQGAKEAESDLGALSALAVFPEVLSCSSAFSKGFGIDD
jgi:hypothetical protein